jgi:hypothetical protein
LAVQYAAITRLDDHIFWFFARFVIWELGPLQSDFPALRACLSICIIYTGIASVPSLVLRVVELVSHKDLTRRCS